MTINVSFSSFLMFDLFPLPISFEICTTMFAVHECLLFRAPKLT